MPDKNGNRKDIVLGYDKLQEYIVSHLTVLRLSALAEHACRYLLQEHVDSFSVSQCAAVLLMSISLMFGLGHESEL